MFTDTDGLTYEIKKMVCMKIFTKTKILESLHKFCDAINKNVIGKMKDEAKGIPTVEFVGLNSKIFSWIKKIMREAKKQKELIKTLSKKNKS